MWDGINWLFGLLYIVCVHIDDTHCIDDSSF